MSSWNPSPKGQPGRKTNVKTTVTDIAAYNKPKFTLTVRDNSGTKVSISVSDTTSWLTLKIAFARGLNLDDDTIYTSRLLHDGLRMDHLSEPVASTLPQDAIKDATADKEVIIEWQSHLLGG
ncbi:uncharacterized protein EHS24_004183 [Apiotrichum porosum]|uniref:Ubiquitin-like domain-containing protein n=1 Tax=Apiotrichum porosum TaxID=105984 RepID=A0A427Y4K1_9TREE|nr:uncharacterized protein EHS24_004183 [Apiotrichum porosum]RSH85995.1 hypothetical protein EHS24_004183 [Apiotrichum porosum]